MFNIRSCNRFGAAFTLGALSLLSAATMVGAQDPEGGIAAIGTAIEYQAVIEILGAALEGNSDLQLSVWNAPSGGAQVGAAQTFPGVPVQNGMVFLEPDFGAAVFDGGDRWIQLEVRYPAGVGQYVALARDNMNAVPYAHLEALLPLPYVKTAPMTNLALVQMTNPASGGGGVYGSGLAQGVWGHNTQEQTDGSLAVPTVGVYGQVAASDFSFKAGVRGVHVLTGAYGKLGAYGFPLPASGSAYGIGVVAHGDLGGRFTSGGTALKALGGSAAIFANAGGLFSMAIEATASGAGATALEASADGDGATAVFATAPLGKAIHAVNANSGWAGYFEGWTYFSNYMSLGNLFPAHPIDHFSGARLTAGGTWTNACDRDKKDHFEPIDPILVVERVASLPIQGWTYMAEDVHHLGPTAQDFHAAFGLGSDEISISTVDADGIVLAAIQGLNRLLQDKDQTLIRLELRLEALERSIIAGSARPSSR